MPNPLKLKIVEQPNGKLAPETGEATTVRTNDVVFFDVEEGADPGSLEITFQGRSPFDTKVAYKTMLTVTAVHDPRNPAANQFVYDCRFTKNGKPLSSKGGGRLDLAPSSDG